ncbi:glycosyltransferase family A protein [Paenibacillus sp. S150]|uniref:glycosyltransferase family A protein n=1 Tax=Paenibacillus sp. S150 TaxID=2749826 RepID=UPI001C5715E2|nr:glycosyltransferase family A protein [Paenibacillus sp. S150]MBW4081677.1 glycosyltransferase family 2 protein [Paenibacillus sp. S150]
MAAQLMWIAAIYVFAVVLVHILHGREQSWQRSRSGKRLHYILITRNHEYVLEWYIRALAFHALLSGKVLQITLMDEGSSDGTVDIASRLARNGSALDFAPAAPNSLMEAELKLQPGIIVDLRESGHSLPLSFLQMPWSRECRSKRGE